VNSATLAARREALCVDLQAQRRIIAQRLDGLSVAHASFPRSQTMRLLGKHPALAIGTLGRLFRLFRRS
jgi:hypothetical protein